ncbi:hypothetical protein HRbin37_01178 [bacterium HR37]|jgi:hypothetical protein|nr:hypothetical protein HRbin37_01178 [bacterium HR37]
MLLLILSVTLLTPPDWVGPWVVVVALGVYHGLNPGMGWLFALSLGLQQRSEKAIWLSLFPIALGHAVSLALVAFMVVVGLYFVSLNLLELFTAAILLAFAVYRLFNYYRHPRWVGMKVGMRDLFLWSFLMASAHGAGLMVAPVLVNVAGVHSPNHHSMVNLYLPAGVSVLLAVGIHTVSMLVAMGMVAWVVYRKLGLVVLRQRWINFDLIWAIALFVVGGIALVAAVI